MKSTIQCLAVLVLTTFSSLAQDNLRLLAARDGGVGAAAGGAGVGGGAVGGAAIGGVVVDEGPINLSICFEAFSLDMADAAAIRRRVKEDRMIYDEIIKRLEKGQAIQECFSIIRSRSGEKSTVENIAEMIYPTEYMHGSGPRPVQPQTLKGQENPAGGGPQDTSAVPQGSPAPALGTSFETRNTGFTLEVEPTLNDDRTVVDLRMAPDFVTYVGRSKWSEGVSATEMPTFESQRLTTGITTKVGLPFLLATPSRPPVSQVDPDSAKRVWFAFVTVTLGRSVSSRSTS